MLPSSWPKVMVRKWLNMRSRSEEFHSDCTARVTTERRKSCSDHDRYVIVPEEISDGWLKEASCGPEQPHLWRAALAAEPGTGASHQDLRMFVGTWNVGGKSPHGDLNLKEWLNSPASVDIYVLGFQEIVPLNAWNVVGAEDNGPAAKWLSLISQALNTDESKPEPSPRYYNSATDSVELQPWCIKSRLGLPGLLSLGDELDQADFVRLMSLKVSSGEECGGTTPSLPDSRWHGSPSERQRLRYCLVASKQMVGLLLCVWVREGLESHISDVRVSCVGRGIMGYLGNKGSVSISATLHRMTFCFVCTHLTSGEKDGNEIRRNSDVSEILRKTRFSSNSSRLPGRCCPPRSILDHDKIVWLGDLNYRLASSCSDTHELLKEKDWQALLEKDQLRIEQRAGRVFEGFEEGRICFAPTYKYLSNSDRYAVRSSESREKRRRTPAWCDRILWRGEGMKQIWYTRGESRFSDHRPVYSLFSVRVDAVASQDMAWPGTKTATTTPSTCVAKVQAEELLLLTSARSCTASTPRYIGDVKVNGLLRLALDEWKRSGEITKSVRDHSTGL